MLKTSLKSISKSEECSKSPKILIIGGGGRENAIAWKLSQSPHKPKIFCIPGNPGIARYAECIKDIHPTSYYEMAEVAKTKEIDFTIVGSEVHLESGIADIFNIFNIPVFGPRQKSACLESSKIFSKGLMQKYNIPTAPYKHFYDSKEAINYIESIKLPFVVKADGLAFGKGVYICKNIQEGIDAITDILVDKKFGIVGERIIIEDFLEGEEISYMAFTDGKTIMPMTTSQDHKAAYNGNRGPNTGGLGSYSPVPFVTDELEQKIMRNIMIPAIKGLAKITKERYVGVLYAGLKIKDNEPYVLEFNVRFGDPEAQSILMRMKTDLVDIVTACINGNLKEIELEWHDLKSVCVVAASDGYPISYETGYTIHGLDKIKGEGIEVFQSGTTVEKNKLITTGGRVLSVTALGETISEAVTRAYLALSEIDYSNIYYRDDIGLKGMGYEL
jgi:phosphoribosylamine--glycine ligase